MLRMYEASGSSVCSHLNGTVHIDISMVTNTFLLIPIQSVNQLAQNQTCSHVFNFAESSVWKIAAAVIVLKPP